MEKKMARLTEKPIKIRIKNFDRYFDQNKFKKSPRYIIVDTDLLEEFENRGLNERQMIIFQKILIAAFKQRSDTVSMYLCRITVSARGITQELNDLISNNFIELIEYKRSKENIREGNLEENAAANLSGLPQELGSEVIALEMKKIRECLN